MTRLSAADLEGALTFLGEAQAVDGPEPFPTELLDRLTRLVRCEHAALCELDQARRLLLAEADTRGEATPEELPLALSDDEWQQMKTQPLCVYRMKTGDLDVAAWSDLLPRRNRPTLWEVADKTCMWLSESRAHTVGLWLSTDKRDFTERDRTLVRLLRPHLAALHRNAGLRRTLAVALDVLASGNGDARAVVLLGRDSEPEFVSSGANELLTTYFGESDERLPAQLGTWLRSGDRTFTLARRGRRLVIERVGTALVLAQEPAPATPLTQREWDVMRCVEAGKTNAEIAQILWITPATVRKHLEHVYGKLGVNTRTKAVAMLRPR